MMDDQEAEDAFVQAAEYSRKANSWGFFSYSDMPSAFCGSGREGFFWFGNKEALLDFLEEAYPCFSRMDDEGNEAVCDLVREKRMLTSYNHLAVMELINKELVGHLQLEWFGSLKNLHTSNQRYVLYLRARFRTDDLEDFSVDVRLESPLALLEKHGNTLRVQEEENFMDYIT